LQEFPYARYAELIGMKAVRVEGPDQVKPAWEEALAHDGPVLYEAITDPNVPPLPPELRFETLKNMTRAFLKGDPAARDVLRHTVRARGSELTSR
jgi:pyruvate dehydrogenase (quinone)